ncbi:MAG TPA: 2-oxoacid:acceptor oxidoreductase family protein [Clostridia bacterium]|jgi:2-oxoglutarate ferredoxin oxidoreductase subunit gamma|nr:MAG: 2-oxoglutarate ferredoxin oxidoreductase subunit gamma [Firmicutes bacterium ADurb.Bin099]HNZ40942.1 2-oxoacid:acceptor oxidoreductase family protein [Clostridia bacterium]HPY97565.1 2-oxoacid:acceptor oxidoreductase family protein [Clostridia bacterium]HQC67795.1 2-oxoacid:acceptor oxidoreductase family protein [Clostridia bacterium]
MSTLNILLAGFGGQGILFLGKMAAYSGLMDNKQITWLPSYGPEMRGGTANCSVCISDDLIGSPLVINPDILVAMNLPSLEKFIDKVVPGGTVLVDCSIIDRKVHREDINVFYVPATRLATDNGLPGLANMIMLGKMFKETGFCTECALEEALSACVPPRKAEMMELNRKALKIGSEL